MKLSELFKLSAIVIESKEKENPGGFLKKGSTQVSYKTLASTLRNISLWCSTEEVDVTKVVRCKNCSKYKLYKKKDDYKSKGTMLCSLDKQRKSPEHYCGYGEEKINEN